MATMGATTPVVKNAAATVLNHAASNFRRSLITVLFKPHSPRHFFAIMAEGKRRTREARGQLALSEQR
jgi:hypothetical protein